MIKVFTAEDDFNIVVEKGTWLVDFSATWCGPCRMLEPVLDEFGKDNQVLKVDIDKFMELAGTFNIMSVPTLLVFKDGRLVTQDVGYRNIEQLKELVK